MRVWRRDRKVFQLNYDFRVTDVILCKMRLWDKIFLKLSEAKVLSLQVNMDRCVVFFLFVEMGKQYVKNERSKAEQSRTKVPKLQSKENHGLSFSEKNAFENIFKSLIKTHLCEEK